MRLSEGLTSEIFSQCIEEKSKDPKTEILRIHGRQVLRGDHHVCWLPATIATRIKMEVQSWVTETYGGGIPKAYRAVAEPQWDGSDFWMTTYN